MKKDFILGVGCQKGGTTWLHSQLVKSSNVANGFMKEYHIFDALYVPECKTFYDQTIEELIAIPFSLNQLANKKHLWKRRSFYLDTNKYFDYFDGLWHKGGPDVTTVTDITPSYNALPIHALQEIKSGLEAKGFNVKVIFLMRDPIERCWSQLRMNRRKQLEEDPTASLPNEKESLEKLALSRGCEIRTRYDVTIKNLESVFDQENIFYAFYENLFERKTIDKLKSFLDIAEFSADTNYKTNVSKKSESLIRLNESTASTIFNHYKAVYEYCDNRFGIEGIWSGWNYR